MQYLVIRLSFEAADDLFYSLAVFVKGRIHMIGRSLKMKNVDPQILVKWTQPVSADFPFQDLNDRISELCQCWGF